ncbi:MAG: hypothetical protein KDK34_22615 [Leptospiraceae bacterium]|nr:hypothetical protein [Leptospiraceae bacterium]MCB1323068.1 hypothetical protein [Leptospiraceae bacterium]
MIASINFQQTIGLTLTHMNVPQKTATVNNLNRVGRVRLTLRTAARRMSYRRMGLLCILLLFITNCGGKTVDDCRQETDLATVCFLALAQEKIQCDDAARTSGTSSANCSSYLLPAIFFCPYLQSPECGGPDNSSDSSEE